MTLGLQKASESDAELVYRIKHEAYAAYAIEAYGSWDETVQRGYIRKNLRFTRLIVAEGAAVGWISADDGAHDVDIADIQILPAHQRKGHGRAAIGIVVREAFAAGRAVTLGVLKNNPARSLYERLGFAAIGATKTHVLMKLPYSPPDPAHSSVVPAAAQQRQPQQRTIAMPGFH